DGIRDFRVTGVQTCALPIWVERDVVQAIVLTLEGHRLAAPEADQDLQRLVQLRGVQPVAHRLAKATEFPVEVATDPGSDDQAPVRQVIQRDRFLRDFPRTTARERRDQGAEPQSICGTGHGGQRDPWVDDRVFGRQVDGLEMIPEEEAVPAGRVGFPRELHELMDIAESAEVRCVQCVFHEPSCIRIDPDCRPYGPTEESEDLRRKAGCTGVRHSSDLREITSEPLRWPVWTTIRVDTDAGGF